MTPQQLVFRRQTQPSSTKASVNADFSKDAMLIYLKISLVYLYLAAWSESYLNTNPTLAVHRRRMTKSSNIQTGSITKASINADFSQDSMLIYLKLSLT